MLKYFDKAIVLQEFPDEITLALNISNCICHCEGCCESYLKEDIGTILDTDQIDFLIKENPDISCIGFMGGDSDHGAIYELTQYIHLTYPDLKVGMYSGKDELDLSLAYMLDYYKIGRFIMPKPFDKPEEW